MKHSLLRKVTGLSCLEVLELFLICQLQEHAEVAGIRYPVPTGRYSTAGPYLALCHAPQQVDWPKWTYRVVATV
jgi:hypothetical protein